MGVLFFDSVLFFVVLKGGNPEKGTPICAMVKRPVPFLGVDRDGHPPGRILNHDHASIYLRVTSSTRVPTTAFWSVLGILDVGKPVRGAGRKQHVCDL